MTNKEPDPLYDLLRRVFASSDPEPEDRRHAERQLDAAITGEGKLTEARSRHTRVAALAASLAAAAALAWGVLSSPPPVMAALEEIASALEMSPPGLIDDQEFLHVDRSRQVLTVVPRDALGEVDYSPDHLAYLTQSRRETWYGSDGALLIRTTVRPPEFFRPQDKEAYYAASLDQRDNVGETAVEAFRDVDQLTWPSDPEQLDAAIREIAATDRGLSQEVEYLDVALNVVREATPSSEVRAEALRLIGQLSILELVEEAPDGTVTFRTSYTLNGTETEHLFSIDPSGFLVRESKNVINDASALRLPAGAVVHDSKVHSIEIVEDLPAP